MDRNVDVQCAFTGPTNSSGKYSKRTRGEKKKRAVQMFALAVPLRALHHALSSYGTDDVTDVLAVRDAIFSTELHGLIHRKVRTCAAWNALYSACTRDIRLHVAREPRRKYRIIRSGKIIVMRFLFLLLLLRAQRWQMKLQSFEYRAKWSISLRWSEQFRDDHQLSYFAYRYNSTKITLHRVTLFNCRT